MDSKTGIVVGDHEQFFAQQMVELLGQIFRLGFITYNFYSASFNGLSNGIIVGENGTILHTTNGGISWTLEPSSVTQTLFCANFPSSDFSIACAAPAPSSTSNLSGTNWQKQISPIRNTIISAAFVDTKIGIAVGAQQTIIRTTNSAASWKAVVPTLEKPVGS